MAKKKIYVLDTNVILHDPSAILKFEDRDVVIPMMVISELDEKKNGKGEVAYNAREAFRILKGLRDKGNLMDGVDNGYGGKVSIFDAGKSFFMGSHGLHLASDHYHGIDLMGVSMQKPDVIIVMTSYEIKYEKKDAEVILVSNDTGIQLIADLFGIKTEYYRSDRLKEEDLSYTGRRRLELLSDDKVWDGLPILHNYIEKEEMFYYFCNQEEAETLSDHEYVQMVHPDGSEEYGRYFEGRIYPLRFQGQKIYGVEPRNAGQAFLLDALMLPPEEAPLVIVRSPAGSGKTFLTLAAALQRTVKESMYDYILYTRSNVEFDRDIGSLPGTEFKKMAPLARPVFDNLEQLQKNMWESEKDGVELPSLADELINARILRIESMSFIRGRSMKDAFMIIDEAQNCTIGQVIGVVTRPGEHTKVVLAGDPDQIDNKYLDKYNNGLSYASERFYKGKSKLCVQVVLLPDECTRSPLATEAARILAR